MAERKDSSNFHQSAKKPQWIKTYAPARQPGSVLASAPRVSNDLFKNEIDWRYGNEK